MSNSFRISLSVEADSWKEAYEELDRLVALAKAKKPGPMAIVIGPGPGTTGSLYVHEAVPMQCSECGTRGERLQ